MNRYVTSSLEDWLSGGVSLSLHSERFTDCGVELQVKCRWSYNNENLLNLKVDQCRFGDGVWIYDDNSCCDMLNFNRSFL